jgi:spermidine synthase
MRTTAVEINASVIAACRMWFLLSPDNDRLRVLEMDARDWVMSAANESSADVLCVDLYDHEAASPVLDDLAFYVGCHDALRPGGLMSVNLFGRNASFSRSAERIVAAFGADQVWYLRPTREGNTIVVAARGVAVAERSVLLARAANIEDRFALPARKWLRLVRPWRAG